MHETFSSFFKFSSLEYCFQNTAILPDILKAHATCGIGQNIQVNHTARKNRRFLQQVADKVAINKSDTVTYKDSKKEYGLPYPKLQNHRY
jgi:hypothetical protein